MGDDHLEKRVLDLVKQPGYRPVKPRVIAKQLDLSEDEAPRTEAGRQEAGQARPAQLRGQSPGRSAGQGQRWWLERRRKPRDGRLSPRRSRFWLRAARRQRARRRPHARHLHRRRRRRRRRQRRHRAGAAEKENRVAPPQPRRRNRRDRRARNAPVRRHLLRSRAAPAYVQIDGMPFSQPILLGDPGAKNAQPDDKVVIEMVRFPTHVHDGEGVITEVLGPRGAPGVDTLSIIREFNLPEEFADDALEEARAEADAFDESDSAGPHRSDPAGHDHDRSGRRPRLRRCDLAGKDGQGALAAGRAHRRRVALRAAQDGARPRSLRARHQRLSARPRDPDAAGDHLQRPGQPAARPGALHQERVHRVHARGHPARYRADVGGDQEQAPLHLRRSRCVPGRSGGMAHEARRRGARAVGPDARAGA